MSSKKGEYSVSWESETVKLQVTEEQNDLLFEVFSLKHGYHTARKQKDELNEDIWTCLHQSSITVSTEGIPKLKIGPMNITLHKEIEVLKSKVEQLEMQVKQLQSFIAGVHWMMVPRTYSYADCVQFAKINNARLATVAELQAEISKKGGALFYQDMWIPVSDGTNQWVTVGTGHTNSLGKLHCQLPFPNNVDAPWGTGNNDLPYRGFVALVYDLKV